MTTHKVADLSEDLLNLFVAKAEGWTWFRNKRDGVTVRRPDESGFEAGNYQAKYDPQTGHRLPEFSIVEAVNSYGDLDWTTDWSKGGPIIERERISICTHDFGRAWAARLLGKAWGMWNSEGGFEPSDPDATGPTPLIAAMRAYVASRFGETVDLP